MKTGDLRTAKLIRTQIRNLQPSIYEPPATELTGLFYSAPELQALLRDELIGRDDLDELPVRTRSKVAKTLVCEALGYTAPITFAKVNPRLRHANIDVYVQQASNLQIWNQEVDARASTNGVHGRPLNMPGPTRSWPPLSPRSTLAR